ncbi:MAG: hypothetical protein AAGK04_02915 [Planctomycetota bacterium]
MTEHSTRAHAKINLALSLAPPEAEGERKGWHRICTWMHAIDLGDEVTLTPGGARLRVRVERAADAPAPFEIDWPMEKDLAYRALVLLQERVGRALDAEVVVRKRVPPQGGLGGGSSDAAAALMLANDAFELGLPGDALREVALRLGSDVPFFVDDERPPRPAIVSGFGETIERTPRAPRAVTLIVPSFGCPTPEVYRAYDEMGPTPIDTDIVTRMAREADHRAGQFNDLALPAEHARPELRTLRARVAELSGRWVNITGSGSAMFIVGEVVERLEGRLGEGVSVFAASLV